MLSVFSNFFETQAGQVAQRRQGAMPTAPQLGGVP